MQKISSTQELRNAIYQLELKQELQQKQLKDQFYLTYESFKTINLIKKILVEMATSPGLMSGIIRTIINQGEHKSNKQTAEGSSIGVVKSIIRDVVKFGITNFIVQHHDAIRLYGQYFIQRIFSKKQAKPKGSE
jgi:hypothetical protein